MSAGRVVGGGVEEVMPGSVPVGYGFPFGPGPGGFPAPVSGEDLIRESIIQLVMTRRGERVMRPELGTGASDYVFENNNEALAASLKQEIKTAIARFEPRAVVTDVAIVQKDAEVFVNVEYVVVSSGTGGTLPIPFGPSPSP